MEAVTDSEEETIRQIPVYIRFGSFKSIVVRILRGLALAKGPVELMEASPLCDNSSISESKEGDCDTVATAAILTKKSSIDDPLK